MAKVEVLVVDAHPLFARALSEALRVWLPAHVTPYNPQDIVLAEMSILPDMVIMDPAIAGEVTTELITAVRHHWPEARLILLTEQYDDALVLQALSCGARACLLKTDPIGTLRAAVDLVWRGGLAFSPSVASSLNTKHDSAKYRLPQPVPKARGLTAREVQIVQLVAQGNTDAAIAVLLGISVRTVQRHMANVFNKLGCRTRSEAVARVIGAPPPLPELAEGAF